VPEGTARVVLEPCSGTPELSSLGDGAEVSPRAWSPPLEEVKPRRYYRHGTMWQHKRPPLGEVKSWFLHKHEVLWQHGSPPLREVELREPARA
jgi:hypothetical protein